MDTPSQERLLALQAKLEELDDAIKNQITPKHHAESLLEFLRRRLIRIEGFSYAIYSINKDIKATKAFLPYSIHEKQKHLEQLYIQLSQYSENESTGCLGFLFVVLSPCVVFTILLANDGYWYPLLFMSLLTLVLVSIILFGFLNKIKQASILLKKNHSVIRQLYYVIENELPKLNKPPS